jgi:hypothetical protein
MKLHFKSCMPLLSAALKYLGISMAIIYVTTGVAVIVSSRNLSAIPKPYVVPLGMGLMAYGIFRGYRLYQKYFKNNDERT